MEQSCARIRFGLILVRDCFSGSQSSSGGKEPIKIGVVTSLTGPTAATAVNAFNKLVSGKPAAIWLPTRGPRSVLFPDRGYVIESGRVVGKGTGQELLQDEAVIRACLGGV